MLVYTEGGSVFQQHTGRRHRVTSPVFGTTEVQCGVATAAAYGESVQRS
jgi:hypothetical protein